MNKTEKLTGNKGCIIIPAYMESGRIGAVVQGAVRYCKDVVVIDDGSSDETSEEARKAGAFVIRHDVNMGKGVSLDDGFKYAREHAFEFVITMDADGQHDPSDLGGFMYAYRSGGMQAYVGDRMASPVGMPLVRRFTNLFMSWLLSRKMGQWVPDSQCGYRLYHCDVLDDISLKSARFAAESEILLFLADKGVRIGAVPIKVIYSDEKSKIHPLRDTIRFVSMIMAYQKRKKNR
ncbi:MAG: hypothetical protein A2283_17230 [Lentisphaerae bacterium RIFOXYA12_FULL_48_11]|nr:MAG: hypothetical protein A2283_17230 [Lentisphaerae bacterium RIFOXYA12_FULL_48_11]